MITELSKTKVALQENNVGTQLIPKMVSIIIPTFREWERLRKCILALENQTYPQNFLEVIIVNNDPADPSPDHLILPANFRLIVEAKTGSYAARNAGLLLAKGEIIGFTDADCIPAQDWVEKAVCYLQQNPSCTRVAGNIQVMQTSPKPTLTEMYSKLYSFPQKASVELYSGGMTANLFSYKEVFDKVGQFNDTFLSFGDQEWGRRANELNFQIHYVETAVVHHPPRDWKELVKREKRLGGGTVLLRKDKLSKWKQIKYCFKSLIPRFRSVKTVLRLSDELNWKHKLMIPLISYYLDLVRSFEILRVIFGKSPNRS